MDQETHRKEQPEREQKKHKHKKCRKKKGFTYSEAIGSIITGMIIVVRTVRLGIGKDFN